MADPTGGIAATAIISAAVKTTAVSGATALAKALVGGVSTSAKAGIAAVSNLFVNRFADYMTRQFEKHYHLTTLVFQNQKPLDDLYIPLTLKREIDEVSAALTQNEQQLIQLSSYNPKLFAPASRTLITDTAGMGKSTLLGFQMLQAVRLGKTVPLFIQLRHLSKNRSIFDVLMADLNHPGSSSENMLEKKYLLKILKAGGATFFLDGYDEIAVDDREAVTLDLKNLIAGYPKNGFAITSRPDQALTAFGGFAKFSN